MKLGALGPIYVDLPVPTRWALLTQLKNRTTVVPVLDLVDQEINEPEVLIQVFRRGSVNVRKLPSVWSYDKHMEGPIQTDYTLGGSPTRLSS